MYVKNSKKNFFKSLQNKKKKCTTNFVKSHMHVYEESHKKNVRQIFIFGPKNNQK